MTNDLLNSYISSQLKKNEKLFRNVTLAKHYNGKTLKSQFGECFKISSKIKFEFVKTNHENIKQKLLSDLKVIPGISNITEKNLKNKGINSITELKQHYRFGTSASLYSDLVESQNATKLYEQLSKRFTSSSPLIFHTSTMFDLNKIALIDIETLGLADSPLFLIGIASFKNKQLIIDQIFVRKLNEEKAALHTFSEILSEKQAIGTFNGKSFDIPFMRKRMERHDIIHNIHQPHFDFKYLSQKAFNGLVTDFRLTTIEEKIFSNKRFDDVSGYLIPYYYQYYLETNNIGAVVPIIDHNKMDLITTAKIFMKLQEIWI